MVSIHHQELVAVVFYVALNGILQGVEARKNVCFLKEEAFFVILEHTIYLYLVNLNFYTSASEKKVIFA